MTLQGGYRAAVAGVMRHAKMKRDDRVVRRSATSTPSGDLDEPSDLVSDADYEDPLGTEETQPDQKSSAHT